MEIKQLHEIELEAQGQKIMFLFVAKTTVNFDLDKSEIIIECTEEQLDNISESWE